MKKMKYILDLRNQFKSKPITITGLNRKIIECWRENKKLPSKIIMDIELYLQFDYLFGLPKPYFIKKYKGIKIEIK
jgi:hypothetical protein